MLEPRGGSPDPEDVAEEPPLDPAVERVQARLRRLMLISGLTTLLGFSAVAVAIFYRLSAEDNPEPTVADVRETASERAPLPAGLEVALAEGTRVLSVDATAEHFVLLVDGTAGRALLIVDRRTGAIVQRVAFAPADE